MVSKTRERLIEVAKQLFAYKGVENTTMNDIAAASEKGRRTIYTYFKNKREIYNAVVEQQGNQIIERLRAIVNDADLSATEKLYSYLTELFDIMSQSAPKREGYRRLLIRDHRRISKIYKVAFEKERILFAQLIKQGLDAKEFDPIQAALLPSMVSLAINAADNFNLEDTSGADGENIQNIHLKKITEFMVRGVIIRHPESNQQTN